MITAANQQLAEARKIGTPLFEQWFAKAKPADLDADIPAKDLVSRLPLNEGKGLPTGTTVAGEPIAWMKNGKTGPAPVFKKGSHLVLGDVGNFSTKQAFSAGAWIKADKVEGTGAIIARLDDP